MHFLWNAFGSAIANRRDTGVTTRLDDKSSGAQGDSETQGEGFGMTAGTPHGSCADDPPPKNCLLSVVWHKGC